MNTDINIGGFLTTRAYLNPSKEALYDVAADRRFNFDGLNRRANQNCNALQSLGLEKGDRVAVLSTQRPVIFFSINGFYVLLD